MSENESLGLNLELERYVERYVTDVPLTGEWPSIMEELTWNEPGEAASRLLCGHVIGEWTLAQDDVNRLWLIGRRIGAYHREDLISDYTLAQAAPGRAFRPDDPPGEFVQQPLLRGGGHGVRLSIGGKREFPEGWWADEVVVRHTMDVARHPSGAADLPSGNFRAYGERDGVQMSVIVSPAGEVITSYPVTGEGVVQNPLDPERAPHVERLRALLDELVPPSQDEPRLSLDELLAVGEWPHVVASLQTFPDRMTDEQRAELNDLRTLTRPAPD